MKLYKIKKSKIDNKGLYANQDIKKGTRIMEYKGKIITVAFHSLEDKVIKNFFLRNKEFLKILTKKPITPNETEIKINPRSRSARMRVAEIL